MCFMVVEACARALFWHCWGQVFLSWAMKNMGGSGVRVEGLAVGGQQRGVYAEVGSFFFRPVLGFDTQISRIIFSGSVMGYVVEMGILLGELKCSKMSFILFFAVVVKPEIFFTVFLSIIKHS